jgi:CAS/CSE protein, C-terminus
VFLRVQDDGQPRFTVADLQAQLQPLLSGLFGVFQIPESGENQYVMKCIARLITFIGPQVHVSMRWSCRCSLAALLDTSCTCKCIAAGQADDTLLLCPLWCLFNLWGLT